PAFRYAVESPRTSRLTGRRVTIHGWCYDRSGTPIVAIRARLGRSTRTGIYGIDRPDVAAAFRERGGSRSGVHVRLALPPERSTCRIEARAQAGRWHLVEVLRFETSSPSPPDGVIAWERAPGPRPWRASVDVVPHERAELRSFIERPTV